MSTEDTDLTEVTSIHSTSSYNLDMTTLEVATSRLSVAPRSTALTLVQDVTSQDVGTSPAIPVSGKSNNYILLWQVYQLLFLYYKFHIV